VRCLYALAVTLICGCSTPVGITGDASCEGAKVIIDGRSMTLRVNRACPDFCVSPIPVTPAVVLRT